MALPRTAAKATSGTIVTTARLLAFFIFCASCICNARELSIDAFSSREIAAYEVSVVEVNYQEPEEAAGSEEGGESENICVLCEEFSAEVIKYLEDNKTQTEVIQALHRTCSHLLSFEQECITLVDYYVPLLFAEVEAVQPAKFCREINLCEQTLIANRPPSDNKCGICKEFIAEALIKLKDPDTQLEIIEYFLKACNAVETYVKKCKRMVLEYGPVILANAEKFLETTDICAAIHACDLPSAESNQESMAGQTALHSAS